MITSDNTVLYTYALWLIGLTRFNVDRTVLRDLMARWFFMSQTTGRYTNSPETRIEEDLARFADLGSGNPGTFTSEVERVIRTFMTDDFWSIRLPDDFITSSTSASPAYQAYLAALNILDADLFALDGKVRDWMDPSAATIKDVEGHHIFPRAYLRDKLEITDIKRINQVANIAPTDWATNNLIADRPPNDYWPEIVRVRKLAGEVLNRQQYWHSLPESWETLPYEDFLDKRRHAMALVVRDGFLRLSDPSYQPMVEGAKPTAPEEEKVEGVTLNELVSAGLLQIGDLLIPANPERDTIAEITDEALIALDERTYDSPQRAARADGDEHSDGWDYWVVVEDEPSRSLRQLVESLQQSQAA